VPNWPWIPAFPAEVSIPEEMSRDSLRLEMSGNAMAFAGNAGVIGLLVSILVRVSAYRLPLTAANNIAVRPISPEQWRERSAIFWQNRCRAGIRTSSSR
jgi:hypothetical protein